MEDNVDTNKALTTILEFQGYCPVAAYDGHDALGQLRAGLRPSVIILDLMMPVMDGRAFLRETAADPTLQRIPVVVCSCADRELMPVGVAAYVVKGSDADVLLNAVASVARPARTSDG